MAILWQLLARVPAFGELFSFICYVELKINLDALFSIVDPRMKVQVLGPRPRTQTFRSPTLDANQLKLQISVTPQTSLPQSPGYRQIAQPWTRFNNLTVRPSVQVPLCCQVIRRPQRSSRIV